MNEYTLPARLFDTISLLPRLDTKIVDDMQAIPPADFSPHTSASMGIFLQPIKPVSADSFRNASSAAVQTNLLPVTSRTAPSNTFRSPLLVISIAAPGVSKFSPIPVLSLTVTLDPVPLIIREASFTGPTVVIPEKTVGEEKVEKK